MAAMALAFLCATFAQCKPKCRCTCIWTQRYLEMMYNTWRSFMSIIIMPYTYSTIS
jgi:hypothetical protein